MMSNLPASRLKNAVDQQAERDLRMLTSRTASSSLNNTPFLSPEETYQLSKRLWQQITVQSLAEKWQQLRRTGMHFGSKW